MVAPVLEPSVVEEAVAKAEEEVLLKKELLVIKLILPSHGLGPDSWAPYTKSLFSSPPFSADRGWDGSFAQSCAAVVWG